MASVAQGVRGSITGTCNRWGGGVALSGHWHQRRVKIFLAGFPLAMVFARILPETTDPGVMIEPSSMIEPSRMTQFAPIHTLFSMVMPF